ncbi:MAG: helix-turn-helix domain-containing protein [Tannerellaceae bacterium]|jgi:transcriptional regulator with XRE-family HTH domain|nr:helix-turn-helix domain-containing protein [Tannerellaceae bacterium]
MADIKERIIEIMNYKNLSHSQFAEKVGIQRSTVSHIMKDRNKPSMRVCEKILARFTDINPDWLLFGKGNMIIKENQPMTPRTLFSSTPTDIPSKTPGIKPNPQAIDENCREIGVDRPEIDTKQATPKEVIIQKIEPKNISKIIIYYTDNTFETFIPEKVKKD